MHRTGFYYASLLSLAAISIFLLAMTAPQTTNRDVKVMEKLDDYIGEWKSHTKTSKAGKEFYYTYELSYFNEEKTILKMLIFQHFKDGREKLMWEGFKGWNSIKKEAYYYGFSPSGRMSEGRVYLEGDILITEYNGYSTDGNQAMLKDKFHPVLNDTFKSTTLMQRGGDWEKIITDEWSRM